MDGWLQDGMKFRRSDGLEVYETFGNRKRRIAVGFGTPRRPLTMDEWRSLWLAFVSSPPWNEERVWTSLRGIPNPHFIFVSEDTVESVAEQVDSIVVRREIDQVVSQKTQILAELRAIEYRVKQLIETIESAS